MCKLRVDGLGVNLILQTASRAAAWRLLPNIAIRCGSGRGVVAEDGPIIAADERKSESTP